MTSVRCAILFAAIISAIFFAPNATALAAGEIHLPNGSTMKLGSTCPVCGMQVGGELEAEAIYAYKQGQLTGFAGAAAAVFQDGTVVGFDGSRCLFTYNTMPKLYGVDVTRITNRYVTDFLTKRLIDVKEAYLVMGTQIRGFMGYDLIPFSSKEEAERFMAEHGGKRIIQVGQGGPEEISTKHKP